MDKNNETSNFFASIANEFQMYIGYGWTKGTPNNKKAENHYSVIAPSGELISDYTKIHPFSYANEDQYFYAGDQLSQFSLNDFTVSTFICYDLRFPEVFQVTSVKSQLIIVAANWPEARREHWRCLLRARAIENQVYMIGVNCVGEIGNIKYAGDSCIIDPKGNMLAELSYQEGLLVYDIKNDVDQLRNEFPIKQDRKINLYKKFYN
jgi:predicted amidohydrolase